VMLNTHFHLVPRLKMRGAMPPLPQYIFMAWYLVKHRDNFTFFTFMPSKIKANFGLGEDGARCSV